jgi:hypothetical protein
MSWRERLRREARYHQEEHGGRGGGERKDAAITSWRDPLPPGSAVLSASDLAVRVSVQIDASRKCTVCVRAQGPGTYPFRPPYVRIGHEVDFLAFWRRVVGPLKTSVRLLPQRCLCACCTRCILTADVWKPMYGVSNIVWDVRRRLRFHTQLVEAFLARAVFREKLGFVPELLCELLLDPDLL